MEPPPDRACEGAILQLVALHRQEQRTNSQKGANGLFNMLNERCKDEKSAR